MKLWTHRTLWMLLLMATCCGQVAGQEMLYVCTPDGYYGMERRNLDNIYFYVNDESDESRKYEYVDEWLRFGTNMVCEIDSIDRITTERPADMEGHAVGWVGNLREGTVYYFPKAVPDNRYTIYYKFECRDSICVSAALYYNFFSEADADAYFLRTLEENHPREIEVRDRATGNTPYVRRTLTRPRRPRSMYSFTALPNEYQQEQLQQGYNLSGILSGMPMELVQRIVFLRSSGDGPYVNDLLPSDFLFGTYSDGHYESSDYNANVRCTIDLDFYHAGKTLVEGYTYTYYYTDSQQAWEDYMELRKTGGWTSVTLNGTVITMVRKDDWTYTDAAIYDLIYFDILW